QEAAKSLLLRLVTIADPTDASSVVAVRLSNAELLPDEQPLVDLLAAAGLVERLRPEPSSSDSGFVRLRDNAVAHEWKRMVGWIAERAEILGLRQRYRTLGSANRSGNISDEEAVSAGKLLREHRDVLSTSDVATFETLSKHGQSRRRRRDLVWWSIA